MDTEAAKLLKKKIKVVQKRPKFVLVNRFRLRLPEYAEDELELASPDFALRR